jgi:ribonuclease HII
VDLGPGMDVAEGQGVFLEAPPPTRKRSMPVLAVPELTAGIDEAGRGPVIGPLVVAGVAAPTLGIFKELGCKDSKLLTPARREALDRAIRREGGVRVEVRVVDAETLDHERRQGRSLNHIEALRFRDIARKLGAAHVIVDAADTNATRFGRVVKVGLAKGVKVQSEHKADVNHPVVGAASIVAKVARDAAIAQLARRLERRLNMPLGSGYSHDPNTQAFLAAWWKAFGELPPSTRHTWATARDLVAPQPTTLDGF